MRSLLNIALNLSENNNTFYLQDKPEHLQLMAAHNVSHHLKKLLKENKVNQLLDGWEITNSKL